MGTGGLDYYIEDEESALTLYQWADNLAGLIKEPDTITKRYSFIYEHEEEQGSANVVDKNNKILFAQKFSSSVIMGDFLFDTDRNFHFKYAGIYSPRVFWGLGVVFNDQDDAEPRRWNRDLPILESGQRRIVERAYKMSVLWYTPWEIGEREIQISASVSPKNPDTKLEQEVLSGAYSGEYLLSQGRGRGNEYELGFIANVSQDFCLGVKYKLCNLGQNLEYEIENILNGVINESITSRDYAVRASNKIRIFKEKTIQAGIEMAQRSDIGDRTGTDKLSLPETEDEAKESRWSAGISIDTGKEKGLKVAGIGFTTSREKEYFKEDGLRVHSVDNLEKELRAGTEILVFPWLSLWAGWTSTVNSKDFRSEVYDPLEFEMTKEKLTIGAGMKTGPFLWEIVYKRVDNFVPSQVRGFRDDRFDLVPISDRTETTFFSGTYYF